MSDGTKSGCTKTGKKVMCINSNRRDLTYRKVYDVFTTQDGVYFIIDDVGDKRYESLEFPYWCEKPDGMVDKANETKHKSKAGKKVKSICGGRADLTYNKVYDVFIDNKGDEFIIDDVGDSRYWSISDDDYYELVYDVANTVDTVDNINDNTKTKPKFKVGDKVKVVDIEYISTYTNSVRVDDVGVITTTKSLKTLDSYLVTFDGHAEQESWWFTDKCIKLVENVTDDVNIENKTTKSESVVVRKFKVGDTVRVTSIGGHTETFKVGNIEVIIDVNYDDYDEAPYQIRNWWFSESELELVTNDNSKTPVVSDGGSSSYYAQQIPKGMLERFNTTGTIEAKDVIRLFLGNDFNMGNIFKAYCRIISLRNGKGKAGIDEQYDLTKVKYFSEDELNYYLENTNV